jgi:hypothetical protein
MVRKLNGDKAASILQHRIQCVKYANRSPSRVLKLTPRNSVWKPLKGPVQDWPLAMCDPRTIDAAEDLEAADLVYHDYVVENRQIYWTPKQKWYYLSNQQPHEAWIFRQSDSKPGAGIGESGSKLS